MFFSKPNIMQNEQTPLPENIKPKKAKRETISELAHRHLRDEKHTTTDEELRNAMFELSDPEVPEDTSLFEVDNSTVIPSEADNGPGGHKDGNTEEVDQDDVPNPYTVLSK
jgi:hypothetical protein